ncbi:MAG: NAD(P)-dependent oxidoreductase [Chloroflexi bacterium]|nr:NAD(P)-dependent oxidoreductase [Chloroflexota bacterium]MBU1661401.1 NAD(P)-dependent oxidoreductase [Chloroflexota bacterium]
MSTKILLTGASGAVGFEAFQELLKRKDQYEIRILSLDAKQERRLFRPYADQVDIVWGDLRNPEDVRAAVDGVDAVLHAAALIPPAADRHPELAWEINVSGTRNLVAAMRRQPKPPKLIYTSSISVYGDRVDDPHIRVGDPLAPSIGDEYARTKIAAERLIRSSGLKWTILRLCGILTPRLKIQPLMFHMPLDTALEWCHSSDAGYALVRAIECDGVDGRIFNLGGGKHCRITAREFLRTMMPIFGVDSGLIPDYAFAKQNFHSGYYADGDDLDALLHFRRKTLQDYVDVARNSVSPVQRFLLRLIPRPIVRQWLMRMSEPLKAIQERDENLISRFYGSRQAFEQLGTRIK